MHGHLRLPVPGSLNFAGELRIRTRNCPVLSPEPSSVPQAHPLRCLVVGRLAFLERCGGPLPFVRPVFGPRRLTTRSSGRRREGKVNTQSNPAPLSLFSLGVLAVANGVM